jgi:hypothetical protein
MTIRSHYLAAVAAIGALAVPAAAQTAYPYGYQQPAYPQYQQPYTPQQAYPAYGQPAYGYGQGYAQNPVGAIIDQLLGNRYTVTDRTAVSQCATAAMAQAAARYGNGYNQGYGNNAYHRGYSNLRVTSITEVQRRNNGLRVSGLMSSGYGGQYGYQNNRYGSYDREHGYWNGAGNARGELSFRCNVAYNGAVTNIRIRQRNG